MGKFPFKRPRIISKKFPELDSSIDGVTKSLNDLVFSYREQVHNALSKKHWMMAFSSIALLLVLGSFISPKGKADSSIFYPDTCLGGWIHPENAQEEQQTASNGDEAQFTKDNSAILPKNTNAEMYCGNFKGKFDTGTKPTKILVSLALTKKDDFLVEDKLENEFVVATSSVDVLNTSSSTESLILLQASSTEEVATSSVENSSTTTIGTAIATPGSAKNENSSVVEGIIKSVQDTFHDIFGDSEVKTPQTDTVVVPALIPVDETPKKEERPPTSPPPVSYTPLKNYFLSHLVGTVFAQEDTSTTSLTTSEIEVTPLTKEESQKVVEETEKNETSSSTLQQESVSVAASSTSGEGSTTTGDIFLVTSTSTLLLPDFASATTKGVATSTEDSQSQNNFLEVFYTFNGITWTSLGELNEISMKYRTFEIPVTTSTSWSDLGHLQIKVQAKKHEVDTPTVYLDGIKIEVLYDSPLEYSHPDFARDTILKDEIIDGVRIVTIVNSDTTKEEVWYMYLEEEVATSTRESASSTLESSTSTLFSSTTESSLLVKGATQNTTQDTSVSSTTTPSTLMSTSTSIIKPVIQKNIWFKFEGKAKGMSGQELREHIKKNDEEKLDPTERDRVPDFSVDVIKRIKGTLLQAVVVQVQKENTDELWVYNIEDNTQEKLQSGTTTLVSLTYPLGFKGGYLFWLSQDEARVYAYDLASKIVLEKIVPNFNGARGERAEVVFPEIPWKVIISTEGFSFFSDGTGEVFSDDNSSIVEEFRKKTKLDEVLNEEELSSLNLPTKESEVTDSTSP